MHTFSNFNELLVGTQVSELGVFNDVVDNGTFDVTQNPDGSITPIDRVSPAKNLPPKIPEWGQGLTGRVERLEGRVERLESSVERIEANMATKADIARLEQLIREK